MMANISGKAKILLVEDDRAILTLQTMILKRLGYDVVAVTDGEEAFDRICRERPDVVVLDIRLPGCDGLTLARRMHADVRIRHIPVAFVTGCDQIKGFPAGGQIFLAKPFTARALQVAVQSLLPQGKRGVSNS